ncbi:hypothetical protein ACFOY2_46155 [Nonomuraea purpurea]|uniref:Small CPxCG-related zinc finger protein n=1 Tax=Nonomuraea purpurea TaxID=1849276 RepID=A0ABV8GPP6_9ACTN
MTIVATRPAIIAATLSPEAVADAKELLDDRGWFAIDGDATGAELLDVIDDALGMRDVFLCDVCHARVTDNAHTDSYSEETVAVCEHCGDR